MSIIKQEVGNHSVNADEIEIIMMNWDSPVNYNDYKAAYMYLVCILSGSNVSPKA